MVVRSADALLSLEPGLPEADLPVPPPTPDGAPAADALLTHYKGARYRVIGTAWNVHRSVHEVIYEPEEGGNTREGHPAIYARDLAQFQETLADGTPRFA
jgi:hypothetical protein